MNDILVAEIEHSMQETLEWLGHIDCMIFQDDKPANDARIVLLQRALNNLRGGSAMQIVETVERECCAVQDMKPYKGGFARPGGFPLNPQFCVHCGQFYVDETYTDEAGSPDIRRSKAMFIDLKKTCDAKN